MDKRIFPHLKLIIIPSWGKLLGYPTIGNYKNHRITKIIYDPVIFISNLECTLTENEKFTHYMFGIGFYYTKFQIDDAKYITDYRRLSGIAVSEFVNQYLLDSKKISHLENENIILNDDIYKIPLDLNKTPENQSSFIKGLLNRYIFIPYKEIFSEFIFHLQKDQTFQFNNLHHSILIATRNEYNRIYISELSDKEIRENLSETMAGINSISSGSEFLLSQSFADHEMDLISENILNLEKSLSECHYDSSAPFTFFEEGIEKFIGKYSVERPLSQKIQFMVETDLTKGIFVTSPIYPEKFPWSQSFPRKTLESWGITPKKRRLRPQALSDQTKNNAFKEKNMDLSQYKRGPTETQQKFELKSLKKPVVKQRNLPDIPKGNIKGILVFLKEIILDKYEKKVIGEAFSDARDQLKQITLHSPYVWDLSKISNNFCKEEPGFGLNLRETEQTLQKLEYWIREIENQEMLQKQKEKDAQEKKKRKIAMQKKEEEITRAKWQAKMRKDQEPTLSPSLELIIQNIEFKTEKIGEMTKTLLQLKISKPVSKPVQKERKKRIKILKKNIKKLKKEMKILSKERLKLTS